MSILDWFFNKKTKKTSVLKKSTPTIRDFSLNETVIFNNRGIKFEKDNDIDNAITTYEQSVYFRHPATHSYDRLLILYRKRKDYENEERIAKIAIEVFTKENTRRANNLIKEYPHLKEDVQLALETNTSHKGNNDKWLFVQYDVFKYFDRLEKIEKLIEKQNNK